MGRRRPPPQPDLQSPCPPQSDLCREGRRAVFIIIQDVSKNMVALPPRFLEWNYYPRRRLLERILGGEGMDRRQFFLEFMRHNPVLCTAAPREGGAIDVNGKVVGIGYLPKEHLLGKYLEVFGEHLLETDERYEKVKNSEKEVRKLYEEHARRGLRLLLEHMYLDRGRAEELMDFEKLATIELALRVPHSSKHTWSLLQKNPRACLVFFQPPGVSFEIRGFITVHRGDVYHRFVNAVHDAYHYTPPQRRGNRPVYVFHVEEVYDNSPSPGGFGRKLA